MTLYRIGGVNFGQDSQLTLKQILQTLIFGGLDNLDSNLSLIFHSESPINMTVCACA